MFFDMFCQLCKEKGMSANGVAKDLSIASGTVSEWKKGRSPQNATLLRIANYFGVSIDYLLGKSETPSPAAISFTAEENAIISALRAQPEMKPAVLRLLGLDSGSDGV